jgi:DHA1 family multidrug resistance protein-like MFS transporter
MPPKPEKPVNSQMVLIAIAVVAGLAELGYAVMNVSAMPIYLYQSMGYSTSSIASIGTAFLLCEGLAKGPFGVLGDRIGRKRLIIAGPLVSVVTSLLTLLVQPSQWYFFVLLRVLDGLGAAALWPAALAMIADVIEEDRRSQAMSLFNVTYLVGIALGPFLGGAANDLTAWFTQRVPQMVQAHAPGILARHVHQHVIDPRQASFYVISILFLSTSLVAWWKIPSIKPDHTHHPSDLESGFSFSALMVSLRKIPEMLLMAFVTFFGIGMVMLIIKLFAMAEFHVSEVQFGALLLVPCLIIAGVSVPLGTIGDRIGKARAVKIGIGICAISMWFLILMQNQIALIFGGSFIGIGFVIAFPSWMAYLSSTCDPRQRGAVMGAVGTAQGLGAMTGAPIGGFLYEHAHIRISFLPWINDHYVPFIGCAIMLLFSWIIALISIKDTFPCSEKMG